MLENSLFTLKRKNPYPSLGDGVMYHYLAHYFAHYIADTVYSLLALNVPETQTVSFTEQ
jgi:hypothetical protein